MRTVLQHFRTIQYTIALSIALFTMSNLEAQMWNGQDTLYGDEWIDYSLDYYKIIVEEDGIYRIPFSELNNTNLPVNSENGSTFRLYAFGQEVPIYTSSSSTFQNGDYIEFYGKKHKMQMDQYMYQNQDHALNPEYSVITDKSVYFLTMTPGADGLRFENVNNDLSNPGTASSHYTHEEIVSFNTWHTQFSIGDGVKYSHFDVGEGFGSVFSKKHTLNLPATNVFAAGNNSSLNVRFVSSKNPHELSVSFNNSTLTTQTFNAYDMFNLEYVINTNELSQNNELVVEGLLDNNDRYSIAYGKLSYPRIHNFNNANSFNFIQNSGSKQYLEIANFNEDGNTPVLYDLSNQLRIETSYETSSDIVRVVIPEGDENRKLILSNNGSGVTNVTQLEIFNPTPYYDLDADYIILSNSKLMTGENYVQQYADYRASMEGGSFKSVVFDIDEIYDLFGYGLKNHPQSIRNLSHWIKKNWSDPKYFFIIGKGIDYSTIRTDAQLNNPANSIFYVPTWGSPGADNLLLSNDDESLPVIPLGRMAASKANDIKIYLDKVKLQESTFNNPQTIEDRYWMKNILHLSGGIGGESAQIANSLSNMKGIIENNSIGADVSTFYKTSTDPVQISESEAIFNRINSGVSIITFFGHASVGTFDFNIDNPDNYENYGKYPLIMSLGCYSGNIHTNAIGLSERFIFYEDKGALAFLAGTGQGYVPPLTSFGTLLYGEMGNDQYNKSIGNVLNSVLDELNGFTSFTLRTLVQQMTLNGDPALKLYNWHPGPDLVVDPASISFEPSVLSAQLDSFEMNFDILNIGKGSTGDLNIDINQVLPSGEEYLAKTIRIPSPKNKNEISVNLPISEETVGFNSYCINIDTNNEIEELPLPTAETNNTPSSSNGACVSVFINDDRAIPIFPEEFSIVGNQDFELIASTSNSLALEKEYTFELDTTELFNSPLKQTYKTIQIGGLVKWKPETMLENGRVYYWRVSPSSGPNFEDFVWENSSFRYIQDSPSGWSQSHYYQFQKNRFDFLKLEEDTKKFSYVSDILDFGMKNKIYAPENFPIGSVNGQVWKDFFPWDINESITVMIWDTLGFYTLNDNPGEFGSVVNFQAQSVAYPFPTQTFEQRQNFINFIENEIPHNYTVIVYTSIRNANLDLNVQEWASDSLQSGKNIFTVLEDQGATLVRSLENQMVPYIFAYKQGGEVINEKIANLITDEISMNVEVEGFWDRGSMVTAAIGPAENWNSVIWNYNEVFNVSSDSVSFDLIGLNSDLSNEVVLLQNQFSNNVDLSFINANEYPFVKLRFNSKDEVEKSSPQLVEWTVLFDGIPDAAINPAEHYVFASDTLPEGKPMTLQVAVENISDLSMDSLLVNYQIISNGKVEVIQQRNEPLDANGSLNLTFEKETKGLIGENQLILEINPGPEQRELYSFNNFLNKSFVVIGDKENPILDVTFDGVHIMNRDLVSADPEIRIQLKDENEFFALNDTSIFKIFLTDPEANVSRIFFDDFDVLFEPADENENRAFVQINKKFEMDGEYKLIVQAEDISGNASGRSDYKVNFQVINEKQISNILNYPNPFSTSTQFVYTLTGDSSPEYFKIQIFSASGRIVKEITQEEIGPLKVGTHRTDYTWNGTDDFGDRLANGVYFYRVISKDNEGQSYKSFLNSTVDNFFNQGFGKLVILR